MREDAVRERGVLLIYITCVTMQISFKVGGKAPLAIG